MKTINKKTFLYFTASLLVGVGFYIGIQAYQNSSNYIYKSTEAEKTIKNIKGYDLAQSIQQKISEKTGISNSNHYYSSKGISINTTPIRNGDIDFFHDRTSYIFLEGNQYIEKPQNLLLIDFYLFFSSQTKPKISPSDSNILKNYLKNYFDIFTEEFNRISPKEKYKDYLESVYADALTISMLSKMAADSNNLENFNYYKNIAYSLLNIREKYIFDKPVTDQKFLKNTFEYFFSDKQLAKTKDTTYSNLFLETTEKLENKKLNFVSAKDFIETRKNLTFILQAQGIEEDALSNTKSMKKHKRKELGQFLTKISKVTQDEKELIKVIDSLGIQAEPNTIKDYNKGYNDILNNLLLNSYKAGAGNLEKTLDTIGIDKNIKENLLERRDSIKEKANYKSETKKEKKNNSIDKRQK